MRLEGVEGIGGEGSGLLQVLENQDSPVKAKDEWSVANIKYTEELSVFETCRL